LSDFARDKSPDNQIAESLNSFVHRVPPGECGFTSRNGNPGTNGVIKKLAAELAIKAESPILQVQLRLSLDTETTG